MTWPIPNWYQFGQGKTTSPRLGSVKFVLFRRWRWSISPPKHCLISARLEMTCADVKLLRHFPTIDPTRIFPLLGKTAMFISEEFTCRRQRFKLTGSAPLVSTFGSFSCMYFPKECYLYRQPSTSRIFSGISPLSRGPSNFRSLKTRWQLQRELDSLSLPHKIAGSTSAKRSNHFSAMAIPFQRIHVSHHCRFPRRSLLTRSFCTKVYAIHIPASRSQPFLLSIQRI